VTVANRLSEAFGRDDFEGMISVLDPKVVWSGYRPPGSEEAPMCQSRDEVRAWFEWHIQQGHRALPRIVAESDEKIVVEMNLQDAPEEELHQVLTIRDNAVVHIQDCPDRESAMAEAGLVEEPQPEPRAVTRAEAGLGRTIPALPVRDAEAAVAFYRDRLGFEVLHHDGGFAVLLRDEAVLHLWEAGDESWRARDASERPVRSGAESFLAGTASCRIEVEDVDALFAELSEVGVLHPVSKGGVDDTDFGSREFATLDLDGNLVTFFRWRTET
jgi:catechol 2,3-dioxygenase-like lactoylglutathione lyase family enzyme